MERHRLIAAVIVAAIVACGGGGKSSPDPVEAAATPTESALPKNEAPDPIEQEPVEPEPADEGAIPSLPPDLVTGILECDRLIATYVGCDKLPQQARDAFRQAVDAWRQSIAAGGQAAADALRDSCKQAHQAAAQALQSVGCGSTTPNP